MNNILQLLKTARQVHRRQSLINFAGVFTLFLAVSILILLISLFLLKSPWYMLIGLTVFLFYRPVRFIDQVRNIDRQCGLNGKLINSFQFSRYSNNDREGYSQELIAAYIDRAVGQINTRQFKRTVNRKPLNTGIQILLVSIVIFLLYPAFLPKRFWYSLHHKIEWVIIPGDRNLPENTRQDISIIINGIYLPRSVHFVRQEDEKKISTAIAVKNGQATSSLIIKKSFKYYFKFFNKRTMANWISIVAPVLITDLKFELLYPPYTGLKPEIKTGRQIIAPQNTRVNLTGHSNQTLQKATIVFNDTIPLVFNKDLFQGEFTIQQSGTAFIELEAMSLLKEAIIIYSIPDLSPLVEIFAPGQNINMPDGMMLDIGVRVSDDYGISSGKFYYNIEQQKYQALKLHPRALEDTIFFKWNLAELNLLPGDEISYYVEFVDNAGNITQSNTYYVYFPTLEQMYEAIHREEDELASELDRSIDEQYKSTSELDRIEQNLLKNRELSWADQEKLRELLTRDKDLLDRIEDWQDELERTIDKINEGMILDPKALSNLQELLKLLNEIVPQELREAIEKLQQQFDQNPNNREDAIKNLKQHQDELTQALERTLEILKRYQQEEKLRQLAKTARDLAQEADSLSDDINALNDETINNLQEKIQQLARETSTLSASKNLEEEIKTKLNEIAQQLEVTAQNNEMPTMSANLNMSATDLEKLYEQLVKGRGAQLQAKLYQLLGQLIAISQQEEEIFTSSGDQKFDLEHQDQIIRSTKAVAESLFSEEKRSLYITPTMGKKIARAADLMENAKTNSNYRSYMQDAMQSVNQVAIELLKNLEQAAAGKSSTGADKMMEQLSNISQGQLSINQSTASLLPLPIAGMSPGIKEQMQRLAGSQQKLRQAISELQQEAGSEPYQDLLKKLTEDMQSVEEDLYQYKIDRQLIERQQQILTRLLDAEKSIRREDYDEKRKSKTGQDFIIESPRPLPDRLGKNELRDLINQAFKEPYPQEYEIYIRKYFEQLPEIK